MAAHGSAIPVILQARTLEWVAISFSNAWKWKVKVKSLNCIWLFTTPWAAHQAPPSMGFSRQEYWSGVPLPSPSRSRENLKLGDQSHTFAGLALFQWLDLVHLCSRGCLMGLTGARRRLQGRNADCAMSIWGPVDSIFMFISVGTVALDHPILISSHSVKLVSTQHVT